MASGGGRGIRKQKLEEVKVGGGREGNGETDGEGRRGRGITEKE